MIPLTWLYAPADHPDRVFKALASEADVVIVDLEDAVAASAKKPARQGLDVLLSEQTRPIQIRVNDLTTPWFVEDCQTVNALPKHVGVRIPKVESADQVRQAADALPGRALTPLIESAIGVEMAFEIASAHPQVEALGLGETDLRSSLGISSEVALQWVRSRVVVASRAAGFGPPAMSVYQNLTNLEGLAASCALGRELGFRGRSAIHLRQLATIRWAFMPTPDQIERARLILERAAEAADRGRGTVTLKDGTSVDAAMVAGAQDILTLAAQ